MNIVDRIRKIIEYKGISERRFCQEIGVANGFLGKVSDVGTSKLNKILNAYPEINPTWLLTGEGEMLLSATLKGLNEYTQAAEDEADLYAKTITWLAFSEYETQNNYAFSFNSLLELSKVLNLVCKRIDLLQKTMETELLSATAINLKESPKLNEEGYYMLPDSLSKEIDKYADVYKELKPKVMDIIQAILPIIDIVEQVETKYK